MESRDTVSESEPNDEVPTEEITNAEVAVDTEEVSKLDQASQPFEGRWSRLISTTNWEKGQIISEWREALKVSEAPTTEFSDDAWAQRVGGVTGQHIGRLRRVFERFGESHNQYEGLFWSHFQAAIDWEDAEMWLEGTIQNSWSVSKMRKARWEAIGAPDELKPNEDDIITSELNEDLEVREDHDPVLPPTTMSTVDDPMSPAGPDFGDEDGDEDALAMQSGTQQTDGPHIYSEDDPTVPFVRPFENIPDLPEDVGEAFETFKLTIIRHKSEEWQQISREDILSALESLKELALAPANPDPSSF